MVHLPRQTPAGETEDREHQRDHRENSWDAANPSFKPGDRRSQHEREKDGECERHEYGLRPVQDDHDEHTPGERHPPPQCLRRIIHKARPILGRWRRTEGRRWPLRQSAWRLNRSRRAARVLNEADRCWGRWRRQRQRCRRSRQDRRQPWERCPCRKARMIPASDPFRLKPCVCRRIRRRRAAAPRGR